MNIQIKHNSNQYEINSNEGIAISIPVKFNDSQNPKFYDTSNPEKRYYSSDGIEYSLSKGAGCNVPLINMNIHCSGTHTESANHVLSAGRFVGEIQNINFISSQLISVQPESSTDEDYHAEYNDNDKIITKNILSNIELDKDFMDAIIIRTLPNNESKKTMNYNNEHHPFLTNDAVRYIKEMGIKHILIDTPSIDRYDDDGKLGNHHIFFMDQNTPNDNTVTELIFVPDSCEDGKYFLSLGIANFNLDAAPSSPVIYRVK